MAACCSQRDYGRLFSRRTARRDAERYRRSGLRGTSAELVRLAGDVCGASVLDVGGGIGAIELELIAAGAARATNVELSAEYEDEAAVLLDEHGVSGRIERRVGDFVVDAPSIEPHDVVVMERVVCCYPDVDALVGAAAAHALRRLLLTYPQERSWIRLGIRFINVFMRVSGSSFRVYVHPVQRMVDAAAVHGLELERRRRHRLLWESASFVRA
jgi:magnesium-protoporphyrin O-methyltransferase